MKKIVLALALLSFLPLVLCAQEQLKNSDFADGTNHWTGDGESASAADPDADPFAATNTADNKGLVIKLSPHEWTRVLQDFRPLIPNGTFHIAFKLSDGLTFSQNKLDYLNIPARAGFGNFMAFSIPRGNFLVAIFGTGNGDMVYGKWQPDMNVTTSQALVMPIKGIHVRDDQTICLAFPPGHGTVTLLHVGLEGPAGSGNGGSQGGDNLGGGGNQ